MLEFKGQYAEAKVFNDHIEQEAISQIYGFLNCAVFEGAQIRIMPDCHSGSGAVIGFTCPVGDKVIPNVIGVDIGCFTGDTKVRLLDGKDYPLRDLVDQNFLVFSCLPNGFITLAKATARLTRRNASLVAITLDNGEVIRCTPDHEWMLRDGGYKQAGTLMPGDSLMPFYTKTDKDGYTLVQQNYSNRWQRLHWMVARSGELGSIPKYNGQRTVIHHKDFDQSNNLPANLEFMGSNDHSAYHRGLVDRNTHWQSPEFEVARVARLHELSRTRPPEWYEERAANGSANLKVAELTHPDAFAANYADAGRRGAVALRIWNQANNSKVVVCPDCGREMRKGGLGNHRKFMHRNNHKVVSVVFLAETEDVFCLNVPKTSNFALSAGVFVHNCGVLMMQTDASMDAFLEDHGFAGFDKWLRANVPCGFAHRTSVYSDLEKVFEAFGPWRSINCFSYQDFLKEVRDVGKKIDQSLDQILLQAGTLGGGNHFIEIDEATSASGYKCLTVHTGSRNFGLKIAEHHQRKAQDLVAGGNRRNELAWLEGDNAREYLHDMRIAQVFAALNRRIILDALMKACGGTVIHHNLIESVHNFIGDDNIIRKGAVSAQKGEGVLIPWNMKDGLILGVGRGNADWNNSAPHGSGRKMSRNAAKKTLDVEAFEAEMQDAGIWSSCVGKNTLDESPGAYKATEEIMGLIGDTVHVVTAFKPVYNFKAS